MRHPESLSIVVPFFVLALANALVAQDESKKVQSGKRVIVTATRTGRDPLDVPYATGTIAGEDLERRSYRTVPQALRDVPGVMVQETAHGHGSPYIRGFTSFRNLFLIDGVRLNNSVFRPGPNQYWNTVDPFSLDRIEIVKGPSSVLYGSDAIGGTVQAFTRRVFPAAGQSYSIGGMSRVRYATAEHSIQGRGELSVHLPGQNGGGTGFLVGGTAKSFGDLEGGRGVGTQRDTGYSETDVDFKVEHYLDADTRFVFLHQRVDQNDVPRTHRTVNGITWRGLKKGKDLRRDFDQNRELTYLQFHRERETAVFDEVHANVSWHRQSEVRDRIRGNGNQELQGFDVDTLGAWLQLVSSSPIGDLTYGVEFYHDGVDSFLRKSVNPSPADSIQGPIADDARYDILDVYLQDAIEVSDRLDVILGARFSHVSVDADSVRHPATNAKISIKDDWSTVVGSARFRFGLVPDRVAAFGGVSQGFRAPNLSDLSRFDSARSNEFEVPATKLQPEKYITYELGVKVETEALALETSYFYTDIRDQILRFPTGKIVGGETEITKGNVGDGHVQGIELAASHALCSSTTVFGNATYIEGRITNFQSAGTTLQETNLSRTMPVTLQAGLRFEPPDSRVWGETVIVHAQDANRLSFDDRRDTSRIPAGGTPGYTVWNLRGGVKISDATSLTVLLENVTDVDYRVHGSGLNRPGRNLVLGLSTTF